MPWTSPLMNASRRPIGTREAGAPSAAPKLNPRLYDDLDQLSKNDFEKAAKAWEEHVPQQGHYRPYVR
jgi:hypothetical protein